MTIRYAIIGSGMMGQEHIRNLALIPDTEVVAVADPDAGMREKAAALAGGDVKGFTDHKALMDADLADILIVTSPNKTHRDILLDLMASAKPILCEKPLCTSLADARAVVGAAEGRQAPIWVAMEYRFMPPLARLREIVEAGGIGRLWMLAIREHRYPFLRKVGDWNRFAASSGGTMVEKCCHFFDLMRLITRSEPTRIMASGGQDVNHLDETYEQGRPDILDNAYVVVDFASGARSMLDLCMFAEAGRDQEEIAAVGDKGKVECGMPSSTLILGERATKRVEERHIPVEERLLAAGDHHASTYYQHLAFLEMLKTGGTPQVTLKDGMKAVAMGEAAERAIRERRIVELTGPPFS